MGKDVRVLTRELLRVAGSFPHTLDPAVKAWGMDVCNAMRGVAEAFIESARES
jgi:hypothetical protein